MRIALYYPWIYLTSGAERVLLQLTGRSRHRWTLFTNRFQPETTFPEFRDREVVELQPVSVDRSLGSTFRSALTIYGQRLPLDGYDALMVVCEGLGDLVVFKNRDIPAFNVCLTPLRVAFDAVYRREHLRNRGALHRLAVAAGSSVFRAIDRRAWKRYRRVFCISQESLRRAQSGGLAGSVPCEVNHVGLGFDPPFPNGRFERYFLLPGRIMWTKNIELGIEAFRQFQATRPEYADFRLIVAGIVDEKSRPYLARLGEVSGGNFNVEFRILPSDEELATLYANCYAVLFTAFNEDWGIVPIEGMAFGKPVIAVNRGGPRESIDHGRHGFLEEPSPAAFCRRMVELADSLEQTRQMGLRGHEHSKRFSWTAFTARIDAVIEDVCLAQQRPQCHPEVTHSRADGPIS